MKTPGITALVLASCCASLIAATTAVAAGAADAAGKNAGNEFDYTESLRLRLQTWLFPFDQNEGNADNNLPVFMDAQKLTGNTGSEVDAQGDVRLWRHGQSFSADTMRYDKTNDTFDAQGNVRIEQNGDILMGNALHYNTQTERGTLQTPHYEIHNVGGVNTDTPGLVGSGSASNLQIESRYRYSLFDATYTTCGPDNPDWVVHAAQFTIDKKTQIGTAHNAWFDFMGVPIFYTPYLSFSLDRSRKTGFLFPTFSESTSRGFQVSLPFYWNIAPNYDLTLTPREMTARGPSIGVDFRYMTSDETGRLRYDILPQDEKRDGEERYLLVFKHQQHWNNWYGSIDVERVSDSNYFTDLSSTVALTSLSVLPAQGTIGRSGAWGNNGVWNFNALVQDWQTLQTDPTQPVTPPYNRAPQLTLTANKQNLGLVDFDFTSSYTDFRHPTLVNGQRTVIYPSLSLPLQTPYVYLTPKFGVHATHYDLDAQTTTLSPQQNRTLPIFSVDSGVTLERNIAWGNLPMTQTLEPRVYYVYIPSRNQNSLPDFDSALQDLSFATLFTENQFSGDDRINDANQITAGATSRFIDDEGAERLRLGLAQRFYFSKQTVTLPGVPARSTDASDLLALASGNVTQTWSMNAGWQYTTDLSETQRLTLGTRYQPAPDKLLNLSYRYIQGTLKQIDISARWPLTKHFGLVGRWNYSLQDRRPLETLAGVEYNNGCCWAIRGVVHSYVTTTQTSQTSYMIMIELNGLSNFGSDPTQLLRRSIGGYSWQPEDSIGDEDPLAR